MSRPCIVRIPVEAGGGTLPGAAEDKDNADGTIYVRLTTGAAANFPLDRVIFTENKDLRPSRLEGK